MNNPKDISYSQMDMYIKDIQKFSKFIEPFFEKSRLYPTSKDEQRFMKQSMEPYLKDEQRFIRQSMEPYLRDEQRFIKQQSIISKLENDPILHLNDNILDKKCFYSYIQKMQTILNTTGQDPLNGILSNIDTSKTIIPEILSNLDISAVNDCMQDIYDDTDEILDTNFEETALNLLENFKIGVNEYNLNANTITKIKIPNNMKQWNCFFLVFIFAVLMIGSLSPYLAPEIINNLKAIMQGFAGSALYDAAKEAFKKTDSTK